MKHLVTVVGARPQFIKSAPVSTALQEAGIRETLIHTGQHYDANMSAVFFEQLQLPQPAYRLDIGSGSHGYQTGQALEKIEAILMAEKPDAVLVYGDTNATLSGALAASKLHIPIAHVEAGLRSFNRRMPEEINRVLTDHLSTWCLAPTAVAVENLAREGVTQGVACVGDVMLDAVRLFNPMAEAAAGPLLAAQDLQPGGYWLLTLHRAETTEQPGAVQAILNTVERQGMPVLFPVHPRIRPLVEALGPFQHIRCVDPLPYFDMLAAEKHAAAILTDSGGVQKEAAFFEVPCITLRTETEWVETVDSGWNQLAGLSGERLSHCLASLTSRPKPSATLHPHYGNGEARHRIVDILQRKSSQSPVCTI